MHRHDESDAHCREDREQRPRADYRASGPIIRPSIASPAKNASKAKITTRLLHAFTLLSLPGSFLRSLFRNQFLEEGAENGKPSSNDLAI
jgi:hypothetical protein